MPNFPQGSFSIGKAAALTSVGLPMIDYLCRHGIIVPNGARIYGRGRGRARHFTFSDLIILRTIAALLRQGIGVRRLKADLRKASQRYAAVGSGAAPFRYLCTDGKRAFFRNPAQALEDASSGQLAFAFVFDVEKIQSEVVDLIRKDPPALKWKARKRRS
jgi:DNA-binding transcriptional MerR regulator